jgi:hypothetical protein
LKIDIPTAMETLTRKRKIFWLIAIVLALGIGALCWVFAPQSSQVLLRIGDTKTLRFGVSKLSIKITERDHDRGWQTITASLRNVGTQRIEGLCSIFCAFPHQLDMNARPQLVISFSRATTNRLVESPGLRASGELLKARSHFVLLNKINTHALSLDPGKETHLYFETGLMPADKAHQAVLNMY